MSEPRKEAAGQALESAPAAVEVPEGADADCNTTPYLRVSEAAPLLGMSASGVYREIASGRLRKTVKRGTSAPCYIARDEIDRWWSEEFVEVAG